MNPLARLARGFERRSSAPGAVWPRGLTFTSFPVLRSTSSSGQTVSVDTAMATVPVYAAVSLLAGAVGSLPLKVYRQVGEEPREEARTSRMWKILHDAPNPEMAADEFWELVQASLLLWGNAFIWKERSSLDVVSALWVIDPSRVQVSRESGGPGAVSRRVFWLDGRGDFATEQDILHIRGLGTDGLVGYSPIQQARNAIGTDMAREEFAGSFWRNGTFAGAVLEHPNKLSEGAIERLKTQIREKSGTLRAGEALILEEDMKWKELGMPLEDAQFVEQANLSRLNIAILFGLPPHKLGASFENRSLTYSNAEWEGLDFVKWSLRRWLIRIESSLKRDPSLFPAPGRTLWPEFVIDALLRSDTRSRYEAYKIGIDGGWLSVKWIQETENLNIPEEDLPEDEPPPQIVAAPAQQALPNGKPPPALPVASGGGRGDRAIRGDGLEPEPTGSRS